MPALPEIAAWLPDMTKWRRDLHQHPELGFQEFRTSEVVINHLRSFGVDEVITGLAHTGVVGVIRGRPGPGSIGLRADMDALPIQEATNLPWASATGGVMHACGHDGHTAMLLGAARYLAMSRRFDGTVYVIFQPAEEGAGGGELMVREGLFERCPVDRVFGLHNWPTLPVGVFEWRACPVMAACAEISVVVRGRGAHAARPHDSVDPVLAASHVVTALQSLVARTLDPFAAGVVSICSIHGGDAFNVIPQEVRLLGAARWHDATVGNQLEEGVHRVAGLAAAALGATAEVSFRRECPATVNEATSTALAVRAAEAIGTVRPMAQPSMAGEDFSHMLLARPGAFLFVGAGDTAPLHHPTFDFNDAILHTGASWFATLVEQQLGQAG